MFQSLHDRLQLQQILGVGVHTGTTGAVYPLLTAGLAALRASVFVSVILIEVGEIASSKFHFIGLRFEN